MLSPQSAILTFKKKFSLIIKINIWGFLSNIADFSEIFYSFIAPIWFKKPYCGTGEIKAIFCYKRKNISY